MSPSLLGHTSRAADLPSGPLLGSRVSPAGPQTGHSWTRRRRSRTGGRTQPLPGLGLAPRLGQILPGAWKAPCSNSAAHAEGGSGASGGRARPRPAGDAHAGRHRAPRPPGGGGQKPNKRRNGRLIRPDLPLVRFWSERKPNKRHLGSIIRHETPLVRFLGASGRRLRGPRPEQTEKSRRGRPKTPLVRVPAKRKPNKWRFAANLSGKRRLFGFERSLRGDAFASRRRQRFGCAYNQKLCAAPVVVC